MLEVNGKTYELEYNMKRIELIEQATGMPTMAELQRTKGMFGLSQLKTYFGYGLKEAGTSAFVAPKKGMEICEGIMEEKGYAFVAGKVLEAIERDCPFFFQGA